jgi:hypothetical protein
LLAAIELVAAWSHGADDPGLYWSAVERVMRDVTAPGASAGALAELIYGLSALGGILLGELAAQQRTDPAALLRAVNLAHHGP